MRTSSAAVEAVQARASWDVAHISLPAQLVRTVTLVGCWVNCAVFRTLRVAALACPPRLTHTDACSTMASGCYKLQVTYWYALININK